MSNPQIQKVIEEFEKQFKLPSRTSMSGLGIQADWNFFREKLQVELEKLVEETVQEMIDLSIVGHAWYF